MCDDPDCEWKKMYDIFMEKGGVKGLLRELAICKRKLIRLQGSGKGQN